MKKFQINDAIFSEEPFIVLDSGNNLDQYKISDSSPAINLSTSDVNMKPKAKKHIDFVCDECGTKYGKWYQPGANTPVSHCATYHMGTCDLCNEKNVALTEPRDFGYLIV